MVTEPEIDDVIKISSKVNMISSGTCLSSLIHLVQYQQQLYNLDLGHPQLYVL